MRTITQTAFDKMMSEHAVWLVSGGGKKVWFEDVVFNSLVMSDKDFTKVKFTDCRILGCCIENAMFEDVVFERVDFNHTKLRNVTFRESGFFNCTFSRTDCPASVVFDDVEFSRLSVVFCKGLIVVGAGDYEMVGYKYRGQLRISCGCRESMTVQQARKHWRYTNKVSWTVSKAEWGQRKLRMLRFIVEEAKAKGWKI